MCGFIGFGKCMWCPFKSLRDWYLCETCFQCVITGKRSRVTLTQAVIYELGKCVGSVGRELGFTTLAQGSREARTCFLNLHPACFPSVCLLPSLPRLCVCYLTLRYARNSASLLFLLWQLGRMTPPPPLISFFWYDRHCLLSVRTAEKTND